MMFSAYDLRKGTWPKIGPVGGTWPVPDFCREDLSGRRYRTSYDPADMRDIVREVPISDAECADLDQDGHNGPGAVEIVLTRLVHPASIRRPHAPVAPAQPSRPGPQPSSRLDAPARGTQAVLIRAPLEIDDLERLEQALMAVLESGGVDEVDGIERGVGDGVIYLYGVDADLLRQAVEPVLRAELPPGSQIIRRYGEPGARQVVEEIDRARGSDPARGEVVLAREAR